MELLKPVSEVVASRPWQVIAAFAVVTLLLLVASSQRDRDLLVDESSFLPDNEVANADLEIRENYGQVEQSTILVKGSGGDALTRATMVEILLVEWAATNDTLIAANLAPSTPTSPAVVSLADMVALTLFMQAGNEANLTLVPSLDYQQMLWAYTGHTKVSVMAFNATGVPQPATLDLPTRGDNDVKAATLKLANGEVPGFEAMGGMLAFMLSKDFDAGVANPAEAHAKATLINFNFDITQRENETLQDSLDRIMEAEIALNKVIDRQAPRSEMTQLGDQIVNHEIEEATNWITGVLLLAAFILIFVILAFIFRSLRDLALGVGGLFLTLIWVDGFESVMGFAPTQMSRFIPVMLVGLAVDYVIHMLMRYREEMIERADVRRAVRRAVFAVGSALLLATFTTVVGFTSNAVSPMSILRDFGLTVAFGILSAFMIFTLLVPAIKLLWDSRRAAQGKELLPRAARRRKDDENEMGVLDRFLTKGVLVAEHHPSTVLAVVAVVTLVMGGLAMQLSTEFSVRDFLPKQLEISQDFDYLFDEFDFSQESSSILIKGNLAQPEVLRALDNATRRLQDQPHVVHLGLGNLSVPRASSVLTMFDDLAGYDAGFAADLAAADTDGDDLPDANLTALFTSLYDADPASTSRLLHRNASGGFDGMVLRVSVDSKNLEQTGPVKRELEYASAPLEALEADGTLEQVIVTSGPVTGEVIINSINDSMMSSLAITIVVALVALTLIFWFTNRSWVLGSLTTLPVLLVLVWIMGTMFIIGIPLNVITLLIGALTVGLGITYAIHITHRFVEELEEHGRIERAVRNTVGHTGTALFGAAVTTMGGFGLLAFSIIPPMRQFGIITAITIFYSFLASVLVLPTFLVLWARYRRSRGLLPTPEPEASEPEVPAPDDTKATEEEEEADESERPASDEPESHTGDDTPTTDELGEAPHENDPEGDAPAETAGDGETRTAAAEHTDD